MKILHRNVNAALLKACLLSIMVVGLSSPSPAAEHSAGVFKNDAATPQPGEEKALVSLLRDTLAPAYDKGDAEAVGGVLAADFQKRLMIEAAKMRVEDRATFLKGVKNNAPIESKLTYAIQSIKVDGGSGVVVALATYATEHFNPRAL